VPEATPGPTARSFGILAEAVVGPATPRLTTESTHAARPLARRTPPPLPAAAVSANANVAPAVRQRTLPPVSAASDEDTYVARPPRRS
jgi:hypothetical protein